MTPQELLELRDHIAAFSALMKGALDAEISVLDSQNAKLQEKLGLITSLDQVQQIREDADAYATSTKAAADQATAAAAKLTADAAALDVASRAKDAALRAAEAQLAQDRADLTTYARGLEQGFASRKSDLDQQEATLNVARQALEDRTNALTEREAVVAQKMQSLRALAA